jgi:hypothetical protein
MSKIELPWISAYRLMQRWKLTPTELYRLIFDYGRPGLPGGKYGLPLYDSSTRLIDPWEWLRKDYKTPEGIFKENLFYFRKLKNNMLAPEDPDAQTILEQMLFKLEDVEQFEKKHSKKREIESRLRKPISTDQLPQIKSQSAKGSVAPQIKVPLIHAKNLMKRWNLDLDGLYQCIFSLKMTVYSLYRGKIEKWIYEKAEYENVLDEMGNLVDVHRVGGCYLALLDEKANFDPHWPNIGKKLESEIIHGFYFKIEDIKYFEEKYGDKAALKDILSVPHQDKITETDAEDFIKNLRVSYESDSEVKIQEPNRIGKFFNHGSLGFSSNQTKQWKAFINVLQDPPHIYELGPAHQSTDALRKKIRKPEYGRRQKRLRIINKKLIIFFNQEYKAQLPEDFKLYYPCKEEGPGKYRFKFQIPYDDGIEGDLQLEYEQYPENQLIDEIFKLPEKYRALGGTIDRDKFINSSEWVKFVEASKVAVKKGWLTEDDIRKILDAGEQYLSYDDLKG